MTFSMNMTNLGGCPEAARQEMRHIHEVSRVVDEHGSGLVTLQGPDGRTVQRRYLHTPDIVAVVEIIDADLVLIREFRADHLTRCPTGRRRMIPTTSRSSTSR